MPTLIGDSILLVFILENGQLKFHVTSGLLVASAMVPTPGAPWSIRPWWHWGGSGHWTSITVKPAVQWRWRYQGHSSPKFSMLLAAGLALLCSMASFMVWLPVGMPQHLPAFISTLEPLFSWVSSSLWKLNGGNVGRCEWGCPGPLASMHHLVIASVINCKPSYKLTTLALSWACLQTQLMAPDSVNVASHASPKLSPSPRDCLP